tara:strand:- start:18242 stop:18442 length:201 start_codon:yes stop_codon:yes gene_type:complete
VSKKLLAILRRHTKEIDEIASDWYRLNPSSDVGKSELGCNHNEEGVGVVLSGQQTLVACTPPGSVD